MSRHMPGEIWRLRGTDPTCMLLGAASIMVASLSAAGQPAQKVPTFEDPWVFRSPDLLIRPYGLASADFDNNGYPDVVVAVRGAVDFGEAYGSIVVYPNLGVDGNDEWLGFGTPTRYFLSLTIPTEAIQVDAGHGDPNFDLLGLPDVVVSAADSDQVYLFQNDPSNPGAMLARPPFQLPDGFRPRGITLANFGNTVGSLDIAVASWTSDMVVFLQNMDGFGMFEIPPNGQVTLGTGVPSRAVVAGEFDTSGLGASDAVTADWPSVLPCQTPFVSDTVSLLRNDGDFTFVDSQHPGGCGDYPRAYLSIAKGAFDSPQANDVAATEQCRAFVDVILGDGLGSFDSGCSSDRYQVHPNVNSFVDGIAAGHLNGGSKPDIVATVWDSHEVSILLGRGDGTFQRPAADSGYLYSVRALDDPQFGTGPRQVIIVDLDQDGFGDIVTSNEGEPNSYLKPSISVLINKMVVSIPPS